MKIIIILLLAIKVAYLSGGGLNHCTNRNLVYNGVKYDDKKYPYVVSIQIQNATHTSHCTGTMVKKLYVVTAAHCLYGYTAQNVRVFLGSELNKVYQNAVELHMPKSYLPRRIVFSDVAIIKVQKPFPKLKKFLKIGGHPKQFKGNKSLTCTCIGFGMTTEDPFTMGVEGYLMDTTVTYGRRACRDYDTEMINNTWREYLCSRPGRITMVCQGDSGGPMICKNKLYGVCSFFFNYSNNSTDRKNTCGGPNMQPVHTFLHYHLKWINNIIDPGANSGLLLKQHQLHTIVAISLCILLIF